MMLQLKHTIIGLLTLVVLLPTIGLGADQRPGDRLPPMAFRSFWHKERYNRQFAEAGMKLVFIYPANTICSLGVPYTQYPPNWLGPGKYDWSSVDRQIEDILRWNPIAKLICMIDLNTPPWWQKAHKGLDSFYNLGNAISDRAYHDDVSQYLIGFLNHTEKHHKDKIAAYMLSGGMTCEWQDYSHLRPWTKKREETFARWMGRDGMEIPSDVKEPNASPFFDPVKDADKIAYWRFASAQVGDTILNFAAIAQKTIKRRVPIGSFYGYVWEHATNRLLYESHIGYPRVFSSPDIQIISSPVSYDHRSADGTSGFMYCVDSLLAQGKMPWLELDHITHLLKNGIQNGAPIPGHNNRFKTEAETVHSLRRAFMLCLAKGVHIWWFDMFGGWFDSPKLMAEITKMRQIADAQFGQGRSISEVLVIDDSDSMFYVDSRSKLAGKVLSPQRAALSRMGAPFDAYSMDDLKRIDTSGYKLVILPNLFRVTPEKRKLLEEKILTGNKTVLFGYAAGRIDDDKLDPACGERLTGIAIEKLAPVGTVPQKTKQKKHAEWTAVTLTQPYIPTQTLVELALSAGVHLFTDAPDTLYANSRLIGVHSPKGGPRTIRLPKPAMVRELFEDRIVSEKPIDQFTETFAPCEARLYLIETE
jgi:beta-galactosidase